MRNGRRIREFATWTHQDGSVVPLSHPFVERLIGTIRHKRLDRMLFWTAADLENKRAGLEPDALVVLPFLD